MGRMIPTFDDLPDDNNKLKRITIDYAIENAWLHEQLRLIRAQMFGRTSERIGSPLDVQQMPLFEVEAAPLSESAGGEKATEIKVGSHVRRKPGPQPLPAWLPRVQILHDVSDAEKLCGCGIQKDRIGQEVAEKLEYRPASFCVLQHIRPKYACPKCEGVDDEGPTVVIAPPPPQLIPKSIAGPGLLAQVMIGKFADAIPFYRQERQYKRLGVDIGRASMCNWALKVAQVCAPLLELLHQEILAGPLVNCDETTLQVLTDATTDSYVWVFVGGPPEKPTVVFLYSPTRSSEVPVEFLKDYQGGVQTDGYGGYDYLDTLPGVIHYGCWAHARRYFMDVIKAAGRLRPVDPPKGGVADEALERMRLLYAVDASARERNLSVEETLALRQDKSKPQLDSFKTWLEGSIDTIPPKSLLGKATSYALAQWARLERYVDSGLVPMDNNVAENKIRPYVVGRKNWLFSGTPEGAQASVAFYSLIETAKANKLEPYWYLRHVFERLPLARTPDDFKALLPQYIDRTLLERPP